jgi:hypothetical protein
LGSIGIAAMLKIRCLFGFLSSSLLTFHRLREQTPDRKSCICANLLLRTRDCATSVGIQSAEVAALEFDFDKTARYVFYIDTFYLLLLPAIFYRTRK